MNNTNPNFLDEQKIKTLVKEAVKELKIDTKLDKIYTLVDGFAGEIKTYREQQELNSKTLSDHNDRIEKLETHTGITSTI